MTNLEIALKKFNKMVSSLNNEPNISIRQKQALVVYNYGLNLLKTYKTNIHLLDEIVDKLLYLENTYDFDTKVIAYASYLKSNI
jgi:hypothetical protein